MLTVVVVGVVLRVRPCESNRCRTVECVARRVCKMGQRILYNNHLLRASLQVCCGCPRSVAEEPFLRAFEFGGYYDGGLGWRGREEW